ncbi:hypothetical protein BDD12DRAFT_897801 [Trichophaea hybrida]|nr:hypothetical protein BDD12DRAFT_897801 [Trichophaea hybrida]
MGTNLDRRWKKMIALGDQALSTKRRILQMTVPDRNDPPDDGDSIKKGPPNWTTWFSDPGAATASARDNPLDLEALSQTAEGGVVAAKLSSLMEKTNTTREDWAQDGELYQQCEEACIEEDTQHPDSDHTSHYRQNH